MNWIFKTLEEAVKIESFNGKENKFLEFIETLLPENVEVMKIKVEKGRYNAVIFPENADIEKIKTGLFGHLDTVPPVSEELLIPKNNGNSISGLGTCDMKGSIIAYVYLLKKRILNDTAIFLTVGEENEMEGIKKFVKIKNKKFRNLRVAVLGEPTNLDLGIGHKGVIHTKIEVRGKASHASIPEKGVNAIEKAAEFIVNFKKKYKLSKGKLGDEKFSFTKIDGGKSLNIIPDVCWIYTDIRIPENFDKGKMKLIEKLGARYSVFSHFPSYFMEERLLQLIKKFGKTVFIPYTTEAGFLKMCNVESVIFGPGDYKLAHNINEKIKKDGLLKYARLLPKLLKLLQNY